ncbi:hypothetical protein EJ377_17360 [Chryseobacterium arthrosphaerae]|uniref:Putative RNase-like toxin toxin1 domain-containing protein n=1 Tax=Chryseobacterium arthrosphaerae TaxID=651561 RepID=A0A432DT16_9FLAO|nr:hypothetical protein EJ377_17360 [Chryseobacterium arthrosphaerae]
MKRFEESPTPKNQKRVDDAVRDLNNSVRDKEILIKGEIPSEYFNVKSTKNKIPEDILPENKRNEKGSGKSNIKEEDVKPIQTEHGKSYGQAKTQEGHTVTMTEKGEIYVCASPCEPIREKYTLELEENPEISRQINELEADVTLTDQEKADWIAKEIEPKLSKIKKENKVKIGEDLDNAYKSKKYVKVKREILMICSQERCDCKFYFGSRCIVRKTLPDAIKAPGASPDGGIPDWTKFKGKMKMECIIKTTILIMRQEGYMAWAGK